MTNVKKKVLLDPDSVMVHQWMCAAMEVLQYVGSPICTMGFESPPVDDNEPMTLILNAAIVPTRDAESMADSMASLQGEYFEAVGLTPEFVKTNSEPAD